MAKLKAQKCLALALAGVLAFGTLAAPVAPAYAAQREYYSSWSSHRQDEEMRREQERHERAQRDIRERYDRESEMDWRERQEREAREEYERRKAEREEYERSHKREYEQREDEKKKHEDKRKRNIIAGAAVAAGAIIGAVIAKNT